VVGGRDIAMAAIIRLRTLTERARNREPCLDGGTIPRDRLGAVHEIEPGDLDWMTAGRGIVRSERRSRAIRRVLDEPTAIAENP
jgi:hypothetical protein